MAVLSPIFFQGEWVGFAANLAHKSDIGGPVPGSCWSQAREIYQEGLHVPPIKYVQDYKTSKDIEALLGCNSRTPELGRRRPARPSRRGAPWRTTLSGNDGALRQGDDTRILRAAFRVDRSQSAHRNRLLARRRGRRRALRRQRRHRARQAGAPACAHGEERRSAALRFHRLRRSNQRSGEYPPDHRARGLLLSAHLSRRSRAGDQLWLGQMHRHQSARRQRGQSALSRRR